MEIVIVRCAVRRLHRRLGILIELAIDNSRREGLEVKVSPFYRNLGIWGEKTGHEREIYGDRQFDLKRSV